MFLSSLLLLLCWGVFVDVSDASDWCYTGCEHTPSHWADISGAFCGGERQSPVNIISGHAVTDNNLNNFTFVNFSSPYVLKSLTNNGHTVKCILEENKVEVTEGGLNATYSTIQFHFHWGDTDHHPGSEHTVNGHRYPMEMHIVSLKKGLSVAEATADSRGIAVLGFFINATDDEPSQTWDNFTSYLMNITAKDSSVDISHNISIDDLIGDVDRTKFYRYMGSLTTPNCNEAVVWTVFQEPIRVNKDLMKRFPEKTSLINVYRPIQELNGRHVYASPAIPPASHAWCYDDHCAYTPDLWHLLPQSHCGGERQSPVHINKTNAVENDKLDDFTYTKFDDKHVMKYIVNTGHTVKCVLKDGMVEVSGGGLGYVYSTLQFHFHWGGPSDDSAGSEHMVDSKRYPMEMHIVNMRKDLTLEEAKETPTGLAVLGFFIEAADDEHKARSGGSDHHEEDSTSQGDPWKTFTSYLSHIQNISSQVEVTAEISIDDLLGDVDRSVYYRYNGSLTTPSCNEAVVWTVFKKPIKVDKNLMKMFPHYAGYHDVYRPVQTLNTRTVYTTAASSAPGPMMLVLLLACFCVLSI